MPNTESTPLIIWGASNIARVINLSTRATFHLLESGNLPAKKVGARWVAEREALLAAVGVKRA